ncbi:MAG TPA: hypothetical protein PKN33_20615 [Phycisphaerae bacterium]|nr:hypothetical protein [Phycisphaerae bacterium]
MPDILQQGAAWLDGQRHTHLTQLVSYQRGVDSVEVAATIGRTEFEQADEYGVLHRIESRDYIIRTADLVLAGETVLPKAGDQIRETDDAITHVYEVMAPGGEPPWRYSDSYRVALRIHTKHVKTETDGP